MTSRDAAEIDPARTTLRGRITAFLQWIDPYKEIAGLGAAAVVALSAGVAWAVSYFATQTQLSSLDCRISTDIARQLMVVNQDAIHPLIDWRQAQIKQMAQQRPSDPVVAAALVQLQDEIKELHNKQNAIAKQFADNMPVLLEKCRSLAK